MSATLFRVVNQQTIVRSILLDKIDRSQGNSSGYASVAKQKLYVPYSNPLDSSLKGYVDLLNARPAFAKTAADAQAGMPAFMEYVKATYPSRPA